MVELNDRQQQETEGKLQFHSCLTLLAQVLVPCRLQFYLPYLNSSSFFLIIDDMVALNCIPNGCCNLPVLFYAQVLCPET